MNSAVGQRKLADRLLFSESAIDRTYWSDWPFDCDREHVLRRMVDRGFSETHLREMIEAATAWRFDTYEGRFLIEVLFENVRWHIIV